MRRYATLYVEQTNTFSVIFQDSESEWPDHWKVFQDEVAKPEVADMIVDALNSQEGWK